MRLEDVIYLCMVLLAIGVGLCSRMTQNKNLKKNIGTCLGFGVIVGVSGIHVLHVLLIVVTNSIIILKINRKRCHWVSLTVSFICLTFLRSTTYFGIPLPPPATRLCQMILTFKLAGLALELKNSESNVEESEEEKDKHELRKVKVNWLDIVHYSFNYLTFTVPYCKYRTFNDYFEQPFSEHAQWKKGLYIRLKYVPLYCLIVLVLESIWPLSYMTTEEFYERSWLYRYWYAWPIFVIFRFKFYVKFTLCSSVAILIGFGAYPSFTNPKPGLGPSKNFTEMKKLLKSNKTELSTVEYNFDTIDRLDVYHLESCATLRDFVKNWNRCVQYWLVSNIYQTFPYKKYRLAATFLVSVVWHGTQLSYYLSIGLVPIFFMVEDIYIRLYRKHPEGKFLKTYWIHYLFKCHCFSYLIVAFELLDTDAVLRYYNSIHHIGAVSGIILYIIGLVLLKVTTTREKKL